MSTLDADGPREPISVVRIISRLNIGGPAIQAITLARQLEPLGYRTTLVRGHEEPAEGDMDYLADALAVRPVLVPWLRRSPGWRDLPALLTLIGIIRRERPQIVHTHAAKGGTLGRLAALVAGIRRTPRPILIHTFHGHSLTGYFSPPAELIYRRIERFLARRTDALIAVSDEVRDELVGLGVADADHFEVVPLGFDLEPFGASPEERGRRRHRLRSELGIAADDQVVTLIARLVPIKRVDRFLRAARCLAVQRPGLHFLVVGDGELRGKLQASPEATALDGRLTWAGFRRDIPDVCFASDVVVLTSDNEGTPVSLIEAQAAGTPVVATRVGGVASVVRDGVGGFVVEPGDERAMANALAWVLDDRSVTERARAARDDMARAFSLDALVDQIDELYRRLLESRRPVHHVGYGRGGTQRESYTTNDVVAVPCPFCRSTAGETLCVEHGAIGVKRCSLCSLIYTSPRLRDPEAVYRGDYEEYIKEARLILSGQAPHHRDPNYLQELELIEAHTSGRGRLLDVGCNMGMLLRLARSKGWEVVGIEPSPALHRIATEQLGLTVYNSSLEAIAADEQGSFDAVAISDVLEHITEPQAFLQAAARVLRPGGLLYVKVPNAGWSMLKQRLAERLGHDLKRGAWDAYEHVVHYTEPTLKAMLRAGGFEPLLITSSRPVQIPVWHEYTGQYFQYPSPWVLDIKRYLGRLGFYALGRVETRVRRGRIGYCAPNLVVLALAR